MEVPQVFDPEACPHGLDPVPQQYSPPSHNHSMSTPDLKAMKDVRLTGVTVNKISIDDRFTNPRWTTETIPNPQTLLDDNSSEWSDDSSCVSLMASQAENCPCQCGGFQGACRLLTLPPSPLHFSIKNPRAGSPEHMFLNDPKGFEHMQKESGKSIQRKLEKKLEKLRDTGSPPRCTKSLDETETKTAPNGELSWFTKRIITVQEHAGLVEAPYLTPTPGDGVSHGLQACYHQMLAELSAPSKHGTWNYPSPDSNASGEGKWRKVQGDTDAGKKSNAKRQREDKLKESPGCKRQCRA